MSHNQIGALKLGWLGTTSNLSWATCKRCVLLKVSWSPGGLNHTVILFIDWDILQSINCSFESDLQIGSADKTINLRTSRPETLHVEQIVSHGHQEVTTNHSQKNKIVSTEWLIFKITRHPRHWEATPRKQYLVRAFIPSYVCQATDMRSKRMASTVNNRTKWEKETKKTHMTKVTFDTDVWFFYINSNIVGKFHCYRW